MRPGLTHLKNKAREFTSVGYGNFGTVDALSLSK